MPLILFPLLSVELIGLVSVFTTSTVQYKCEKMKKGQHEVGEVRNTRRKRKDVKGILMKKEKYAKQREC